MLKAGNGNNCYSFDFFTLFDYVLHIYMLKAGNGNNCYSFDFFYFI